MKEVGRNAPCPCGSGKKYKKCCLKKYEELYEIRYKINVLYAKLKSVNNKCLKKANLEGYPNANFEDAMDLTITSNGLSLIKSILDFLDLMLSQEDKEKLEADINICSFSSITNALNLRNIIECFALINMNEQGDITYSQKMLFVEQYKLIEYKLYFEDGRFDEIIDRTDLRFRYLMGLKKFQSVEESEKKIERFFKTRIPFLCQKNINFNSLIEKYCPEYLDFYVQLSKIVHPISYKSCMGKQYNDWYLKLIQKLSEKYGDVEVDMEKELPYFAELQHLYQRTNAVAYKVIVETQQQCLFSLSTLIKDKLDDSFFIFKRFFIEMVRVLNDINFDDYLGYCENVKIKFKVIAEMFACSNKIISEIISNRIHSKQPLLGNVEMLRNYEEYQNKIQEKCLTEKDEQAYYDFYKKYFPQSNIDLNKFLDEFKKTLGFMINENGEVPSLEKLVNDFFAELYDNTKMTAIEVDKKKSNIKVSDFYWLCYKESNNMSHGNGYLYFTNIGAWKNSVPVIQFFDTALCYIMLKLQVFFKNCALDLKNNESVNIREIGKSFIEVSDALQDSIQTMKYLEPIKNDLLAQKKDCKDC